MIMNVDSLGDADPQSVEFLVKMGAALRGELGEEQMQALERELLASPQRRKLFTEVQVMGQCLTEVLRRQAFRGQMLGAPAAPPIHEEEESAPHIIELPPPVLGKPAPAPRSRLALVGVALVLGCTLGLGFWWTRPAAGSAAAASVLSSGSAPKGGILSTDQTLGLESGVARVEFVGGARVWVKAPVQLVARGPASGACSEGTLRVETPASAGSFELSLPQGRLLLNGGVAAVDAGERQSRVQLLEGTAQWLQEGQPGMVLEPGNAVSLTREAPRRFEGAVSGPSPHEVDSALEARARARYEVWRAGSFLRDEDPALALHLDFEAWPGALPQHPIALPQGAPALRLRELQVQGCARTQGRWPAKGALEFTRPVDRIRLVMEGGCASFTLSAWVRFAAPGAWAQPLLVSQAQDAGSLQWTLTRSGTLCLEAEGLGTFESAACVTPADTGRWMHVAVTLDAAERRVRHFLDGREVGRSVMYRTALLQPGVAHVGNTMRPESATRPFSGAMDEFLFHTRALNPTEVRELFSVGEP